MKNNASIIERHYADEHLTIVAKEMANEEKLILIHSKGEPVIAEAYLPKETVVSIIAGYLRDADGIAAIHVSHFPQRKFEKFSEFLNLALAELKD